MRRTALLVLPWLLACVWGCGDGRGQAEPPVSRPAASPSPPPAAPDRPWSASEADRPRIVVLGDSLSAGLGLDAAQSFPSLLQQRLDAEGYRYAVVNAGVSGDTSAGGLRRLEWSLDGDVRILILALGGNDGLRGLPPAELRKNLTAIIDRARARGLTVILAGMEAPPNNGADYTKQFRAVFADLARADKIRLIPFLLQGVAGNPALNQADGIHPNVAGARLVAELVWKTLEPALTRSETVVR